MDTESFFGRKFFITDETVQQQDLMKVFKEFWAENGDFISIQYAGTESTSTKVTLNGKKGIMGMLSHANVSINRFFQGTFSDEFKQLCIDLFLQQYYGKKKGKIYL